MREHRDELPVELLADRLGCDASTEVPEADPGAAVVDVQLTAISELSGFALDIGDHQVRLGLNEARTLADRCPTQLDIIAADQGDDGDRFTVVIGGQTLVLTADEALALADLPSQLHRVFAMVGAPISGPTNGERLG